MRFNVISTLLLASGLASALPSAEVPGTSPNLMKRDSFDCAGSGMCGSAVNFVRDCDTAVNHVLIRNNDVNYGAAGSNKADGAQRGRCKIFIAGPATCTRTGNQMWDDYQQIRKAKCARCGSKHWGTNNACRTTVNYVS